MVTSFRIIFIISFVFFVSIKLCSSNNQKIECELVQNDRKNSRISQNLKFCHIKKFNISKNEENIPLTIDESDNNYTGIILKGSKFFRFPKQLLNTFPHAISIEIVFSGMTEIDDYTFENASHILDLFLGYNKIQKITELTFVGAENLISLNLEVNSITEISSNAFNGLPKLEILKLLNNKITALDKNTFAMLKYLKVLYLTRNPLVHIDPQLVVHNERLSELGLSDLKINQLELELNTKNMKKLDIYGVRGNITLHASETIEMIEIERLLLKYNRYTNWTQISIDKKIHVRDIDLSYSRFTSLNEVPEFLQHATTIVFDSNSIQNISQNFMNLIKNVESLDLSGNEIQMVPNMFEPLKKLKELFLRGNNLGTIDHEWFTGLTNLEKLDIGSNNLAHFDYISLVNTLPSLRKLNIQGGVSDFKCSYLRKMVKDLRAINRLDVINYQQVPEESENYIYDIRCE